MTLDYVIAKKIIESSRTIEEASLSIKDRGYEVDQKTLISLWDAIKGTETRMKQPKITKSKPKTTQMVTGLLNVHSHLLALLSEIKPIPECKAIFDKYLKIVKEEF